MIKTLINETIKENVFRYLFGKKMIYISTCGDLNYVKNHMINSEYSSQKTTNNYFVRNYGKLK